ncbi:serine/threonine protein kinase [Acanthopleuribacter pedis]|uniref:Serine/threonine protein kinase n=1 Tax=Acanthopleuribacter pedis TaxID=442870 RepID=A0A8J7U1K4_9BACT|nr:serine/threonine-protein kinase [Acanthopleuribacter pedis]MBO1318288.1 serine/threonine protein kinase [Acanthopleuribacter pedis]
MSQKAIGKYEIIETLQESPLSAVHRCWDPDMRRRVVVKTIPESVSEGWYWLALENLENEARIGVQVSHPTFLTYFTCESTQNPPHLVMEEVKGRSLSWILEQPGFLCLEEVMHILEGVAIAVSALHGQGFIHCDITPGNIMIQEDQKIRLIDLGLARSIEGSAKRLHEKQATPEFASPEQISHQKLDIRSDVFSFAALAHFLFTGESPYRGSNSEEVLEQRKYESLVISEPFPEMRFEEEGFRQLFTKALSLSPRSRPQTIDDFLSSLIALPKSLEDNFFPDEERTIIAFSKMGKTMKIPDFKESAEDHNEEETEESAKNTEEPCPFLSSKNRPVKTEALKFLQ